MSFVTGYITIGVIILVAYTIYVQKKATGLPLKEILSDWTHPIVFVLLWPIDSIYCMISTMRKPKEEISEILDKYHP